MAQTSQLLEQIRVERYYIVLRFKANLDYETVVGSAFEVIDPTTDVDVDVDGNYVYPVAGPNVPLKPFATSEHYDSIRGEVKLFFDSPLPDKGEYVVQISGLYDVTGNALASEALEFGYYFDNDNLDEPQVEDTVQVIDKSIRTDVVVDTSAGIDVDPYPDFYIVNSDPKDGEIAIRSDENSGRVSVVFSSRPSIAYINDKYVMAQKKKMGVGLHRWEDVDALISLDTDSPTVFVSFPSTDTEAPQYDQEDLTYFQDGYKYRVLFKGEVAPSA